MVFSTFPVAASIRGTAFWPESSTHTEPAPKARPQGEAPTFVGVDTSCVRGSMETTVFSPYRLPPTLPAAPRTPQGWSPTRTRLTTGAGSASPGSGADALAVASD